MYFNFREKQKFLKAKEKEEMILREFGLEEDKILYLRKTDEIDFNKNRNFYRNERTFVCSYFENKIQVNGSHNKEYSWEEILNAIDDPKILFHLKRIDSVLQSIMLMRINGYTTKEISKELKISENAIRKRISSLRNRINF